jgi:hypothetical protein
MQINRCNVAHKQNKGQKSHDYLNKCRKILRKNQQYFMIKSLKKTGIEGQCLNEIKAIHDKPMAKIRQTMGKTENISSNVRM